MDLIKRSICLNRYKYNGYDSVYWGNITGKTDGGVIIYYTGQTNSQATIVNIPLLITRTFDDSGIVTDINDWVRETTNGLTNKVNFIGEQKIDEFRRYSKKTGDVDLYNPIENSGFTQTLNMTNGLVKKIKGVKSNKNGGNQALYEYIIGASPDDLVNSGIHYSDIDNLKSNISYTASGLTPENSVTMPYIKIDYLLGVVEQPKVKKDVFIERGVNSTFVKNLILGDIRTMDDMELYGNGILKIKDN